MLVRRTAEYCHKNSAYPQHSSLTIQHTVAVVCTIYKMHCGYSPKLFWQHFSKFVAFISKMFMVAGAIICIL